MIYVWTKFITQEREALSAKRKGKYNVFLFQGTNKIQYTLVSNPNISRFSATPAASMSLESTIPVAQTIP